MFTETKIINFAVCHPQKVFLITEASSYVKQNSIPELAKPGFS
jgi:hypothetical protein